MAVMAVVECARPLCARLTPDSIVPRVTIWPSLRAQPSNAGCGLKPLRGGSAGDGVTVIFSVKCPLIVEGESLGIVGNLDVLGSLHFFPLAISLSLSLVPCLSVFLYAHEL